VDQIHYPWLLRFIKRLKPGDWAVECVREGKKAKVWPPRQLLSVESYPRGHGRRRWVLQLEAPDAEETLSLTRFRRNAPKRLKLPAGRTLHTKPIHDGSVADAIMRLWTPAGRVAQKRRGMATRRRT
jgi:hypothetical protein